MQGILDAIQPVLAFESVGMREPTRAIGKLSVAIAPGEVVLIRLDRERDRIPLADVALGLQPPDEGRVCFEGRDWMTMPAFDQASARGRCGVVFESSAWISSLSVPENIALRREHLSREPTAAILADARAKAHLAGLREIDERRPDFVPDGELRVLEWVRAFVGQPVMVVLEQAERGAPRRLLGGLGALMRQATQLGTAILWISCDGSDALPNAPVPTRRVDEQDGIWVEIPEGST